MLSLTEARAPRAELKQRGVFLQGGSRPCQSWLSSLDAWKIFPVLCRALALAVMLAAVGAPPNSTTQLMTPRALQALLFNTR